MAKAKTKRPTRDEFELEELGERLSEAKDEGAKVSLNVWGEDEPVIGIIVNMDARTRTVHLEDRGEITKVPFLDIMQVGNAG
jgi:hypothetical protein